MAALLGLLRTGSPSVTEHAASVFAVMANNPATHFQVRAGGRFVGAWVSICASGGASNGGPMSN